MAKDIIRLGLASLTLFMLPACSIASMGGAAMTEQEQDIAGQMDSSKYQPATRLDRERIETQDNFTQAAFWSREYDLNPADLEAAIKLAASVRKMGNPARAVEITQTTRAMYPDNPYLIAEYAAALIASDRGEEALKSLDQALRAAPGYARLWSLKGAALDQVENYAQARRYYGRALQIAPNDPNIMANLGLSYALAGDPQSAETWLRRAARQPNASEGIRKNLQMVMQLQGKTYNSAQSEVPNTGQDQRQTMGQAMTTAPRPTPVQTPRQQNYRATAPQNYTAPAPQHYRSPAPQNYGYKQSAPKQHVNPQPALRGSAYATSQARAQQARTAQMQAAATPRQHTAQLHQQMLAGAPAAQQAASRANILSRISGSLNKPVATRTQAAPTPYGPGSASAQSYAPTGSIPTGYNGPAGYNGSAGYNAPNQARRPQAPTQMTQYASNPRSPARQRRN